MNTQKVWFVTGASKGLGLALVKKLLQQNVKVAATSRYTAELSKAIANESEHLLSLEVDLKNETSVEAAIRNTITAFGKIEVIVNNAGYGLLESLEELTDEEAREHFNVNVFGSLNVIRKALFYLRDQGSGHIFYISSIGGFTGTFPRFGIYGDTIFAMEGFSESLSTEVKQFGIKLTFVAQGYFKMNFLSGDSLLVPKNAVDAYTAVRSTQNMHQNEINNQQPGNPERAVDVMIENSEEQNPSLHLFPGADAYEAANNKIVAIQNDMNTWELLGTTTNFA